MAENSAQSLQKRLEYLRERMTDLLVEMELRQQRDSTEAFDSWWESEGLRGYYAFKAEAERLEQQIRIAEMFGPEDTADAGPSDPDSSASGSADEYVPAVRPRLSGRKEISDPWRQKARDPEQPA